MSFQVCKFKPGIVALKLTASVLLEATMHSWLTKYAIDAYKNKNVTVKTILSKKSRSRFN